MKRRTVWVYRITQPEPDVHMVPVGATFLHAAEQHGAVALWFDVPDTDAPLVPRRFLLVGTGQEVPGAATYLGTALHLGGSLVLHAYEVPA